MSNTMNITIFRILFNLKKNIPYNKRKSLIFNFKITCMQVAATALNTNLKKQNAFNVNVINNFVGYIIIFAFYNQLTHHNFELLQSSEIYNLF